MDEYRTSKGTPPVTAGERIGGERYIGERESASQAQLSAFVENVSIEIKTLVQSELEAAKAEMARRSMPAMTGIGLIGMGGLLWLGSFGAITVCLISALNLGMERWLAGLIVAIVYGVGALAMMMRGKSKLKDSIPRGN